jgi:hypothetical protein
MRAPLGRTAIHVPPTEDHLVLEAGPGSLGSMFGRAIGVGAVVGVLTFASVARADEGTEDPTTDLARGRALVRFGLLIEAREAMLDATRRPKGNDEPATFDEARSRAREEAVDLAWRIPKAILVAGRSAEEVTVLVDGTTIDRGALGSARRMNPGEHVLVARANDGAERHVTFVLVEGETTTVTVDLESNRIVPAAPPPPEKRAEGGVSPFVWGGFGMAGLGLAVGAGAGLASMSTTSRLDEKCANAMCPQSVRGDIETAQTWATVSTVGFVTGAAGLVVGVVALAIGPSKRETSTRVSVGPTSVGVAGSF